LVLILGYRLNIIWPIRGGGRGIIKAFPGRMCDGAGARHLLLCRFQGNLPQFAIFWVICQILPYFAKSLLAYY